LLFLFGRSDSTISVMGANIYPQDVEHGLYAHPDLARHVQRFCLSLEEHADLRSMATVNVELRTELDAQSADGLERELGLAVTTSLERLNRDFANARREDPQTTAIQVRVFRPGCGPFAAGRRGIKNRYVVHADA
jgi:phenylacetate-CoA ligase